MFVSAVHGSNQLRVFPFLLFIQHEMKHIGALPLIFFFWCLNLHFFFQITQFPHLCFDLAFTFYLPCRLIPSSLHVFHQYSSRPSFFRYFVYLPLTHCATFTVPKKSKADWFNQMRSNVLDSRDDLSQ